MKPLLKIMLIMAAFFASTFLIAKSTGVFSIENVQASLEAAKTMSPLSVVLIVVLLLFLDLFIAVPTLSIMILGGYFLGHSQGALAAVIGLFLAGICGYALSYLFGDKLINFIIKNEEQRTDAISAFKQHGVPMILLSRSMPILPELTACMAGMTKMPFYKFLLAWLASTVPYALIATYAGALSSIDNPKPAIFTAIGLTLFFWSAWFVFNRFKLRAGRLA